MSVNQPIKSPVAYKWLSYCLVLGFIYYWLFTLGLLFYPKSIYRAAPRQTNVYSAFCKQTWRLFAYTKLYNRQLNLITRNIGDPSKADTVDLVQFSIARKRKAAPFNDYYDGFDVMLYSMMNDFEHDLYRKQKLVRRENPGQADSFYMRQGNALALMDNKRQQSLNNLEQYGRYVLRLLKKDTTGKEFQLVMINTYIPPKHPPAGSLATGDDQTVFISAFKPF